MFLKFLKSLNLSLISVCFNSIVINGRGQQCDQIWQKSGQNLKSWGKIRLFNLYLAKFWTNFGQFFGQIFIVLNGQNWTNQLVTLVVASLVIVSRHIFWGHETWQKMSQRFVRKKPLFDASLSLTLLLTNFSYLWINNLLPSKLF